MDETSVDGSAECGGAAFGAHFCGFCSGDPAWLHVLRSDQCLFYIGGKEHALDQRFFTCIACEDLWSSRDTDGLVDRAIAVDWEMYQGRDRDEVLLQLLPMITAFRNADLTREAF